MDELLSLCRYKLALLLVFAAAADILLGICTLRF
jgi:hypothetical protein